jgi:hypothetical protein
MEITNAQFAQSMLIILCAAITLSMFFMSDVLKYANRRNH